MMATQLLVVPRSIPMTLPMLKSSSKAMFEPLARYGADVRSQWLIAVLLRTVYGFVRYIGRGKSPCKRLYAWNFRLG